MDTILNILNNNKEWIFSGVGIVIITFTLKILTKIFKSKHNGQSQNIRNNSVGVQSSNDIKIEINGKVNNDE
jgi:hypothetical protein